MRPVLVWLAAAACAFGSGAAAAAASGDDPIAKPTGSGDSGDAPPAASVPAEPALAPVIAGPDGTPHYLLGINAYGSEADIVRIEAAAGAHGWPFERDPDGSRGRTIKLMIMFPRADADQVRAFLDQLSRGEFGRIATESMILAVRNARPGQ